MYLDAFEIGWRRWTFSLYTNRWSEEQKLKAKTDNKKAKKGIMMKLKDIEKLTETSVTLLIEENIKYSDIEYEKFFDSNFLKVEINNIIKNIK